MMASAFTPREKNSAMGRSRPSQIISTKKDAATQVTVEGILFEDFSDDDEPIVIEQVFRPIELIDLTDDEPEPRKRFCYCRRVNRGDNPNLLAKKGLCTNAANPYRKYYACAKKRGVSFRNNMSIIPYINYKIRLS